MKISPKYLLGGALIGFILLVAAFVSLPDGNLHLVFCNVGQGDAIYIRTPNGQDILIDGGPNDRVLSCLGEHMPFYDRTIELMALSHPQADHLTGLISVLERYSVNYFVSTGLENQSEGYKKLMSLIRNKKVQVKNEAVGGKIDLDNLRLITFWPDNRVLGLSNTGDANEASLVLGLSYGQFSALLTGDAGQDVQKEISLTSRIGLINILKVPHHGSKTALMENFLSEIRPQLAVISVGKNSYGHPTKETLELLNNVGSKILRTDRDGEIEIVSDGGSWWRKN